MNGWEPREFTRYEYDEDGRLVGTVTVREPEFSTPERNLLLAHLRLEADIGPHGIPMSEATDAKNQFAFRAPSAPTVDWAEKTRDDAKDAYYKANPEASHNGHLWSVGRRSTD